VIILDTNVISELTRPVPAEAVLLWVAARPTSALFTTAASEAEVRHGLAVVRGGRRRAALPAVAEGIFGADLAGRVPASGRVPDSWTGWRPSRARVPVAP
jgi:toxin FitB